MKPAARLRENGDGLSDCAKKILSQYFPKLDLNKVKIYTHLPYGVPSQMPTMRINAITIGKTISFAPGKFDEISAFGLGDIGHELTHVLQFQNYGIFGFAEKYLNDYSANLKSGKYSNEFEAYKNIPFELEAEKMRAIILAGMITSYGENPCGNKK
jgi:hypothetical protein